MEIRVKVIPKSSKTAIAGEMPDGTIRIRVAAVPDKGKANRALCEFLAGRYGVPVGQVTILSGFASPLKRIRIEGL